MTLKPDTIAAAIAKLAELYPSTFVGEKFAPHGLLKVGNLICCSSWPV